MSSHAHHHDHNMHHDMMDANVTATDSPLSSTAATVIQAIMTTVMAHSVHHDHHSSAAGSPAGHSMVHHDSGPTAIPVTGDHSQHHIGSSPVGHDSASGDHMLMYFHSSVDAIILFKEWTVSSVEGMVGSVIGVILLAMLYEGLKFFREYLFKKYFTSLEYSSVSVLGDDGKTVTEVHRIARNRMLSWPHIIQTVLHILQMVLSYFLMLIFMTYNVWLCLAVVVGAGGGYFLFGWRKATVVDITEHCH